MSASSAKHHMRARGRIVGMDMSGSEKARSMAPFPTRWSARAQLQIERMALSGPLQYRRMTDFALIAAIRRINRGPETCRRLLTEGFLFVKERLIRAVLSWKSEVARPRSDELLLG